MSFTTPVYSPTDGLKNTTSFPTTPASETAARKQFQDMFDQVTTLLNALIDELEAAEIGTSGAESIGSAAIENVAGTTVRAQIADLKTQIDSTAAGSVGTGTIINDNLATDIKVGSLESLSTTEKSNVVDAINEVLGDGISTPDHIVGAKFTKSTTQLISSNTETLLTFNTYTYNPDDSQDVSNPTRMVCRIAGNYTINASGYIIYGAAGDINTIRVKKNGSVIGVSQITVASLGAQYINAYIDLVELSIGDYLEITLEHDSETSKNASGTLSMRRNRF